MMRRLANRLIRNSGVSLASSSVWLALAVVLALPAAASAHVVVRPAEAETAAYQTFTVSVPNEKDVAVSAVRLVVPDDMDNVTPTVKPGWQIDIKKSGDSGGKVSEISWTGGAIPAGQRDDFTFSAQAPAKVATVQWKAYQTYEDGSVVSWDQTPKTGDDDESADKGPYSTTNIVKEATVSSSSKDAPATGPTSGNLAGAYGLAGTALLVAIMALVSKRKQ